MDKFNFLNDEEKSLLETFNKNETMREAVKKVLLMGIYQNGVVKKGQKFDPTINWALSLIWNNDGTLANSLEVGENVRIIAEGIKSIELAFKELEKFKLEVKPAPKKNPAR